MTYEVVLTKDAENDFDNFIQYLIDTLCYIG